MGGLSWWHWLVIGGAFVLLFGAKKLPDAARGVGRSLRILKSEMSAMTDEPGATPAAATAPAAATTPATATSAPAVAAAPAAAVTDAPSVPSTIPTPQPV